MFRCVASLQAVFTKPYQKLPQYLPKLTQTYLILLNFTKTIHKIVDEHLSFSLVFVISTKETKMKDDF
jgi:hypothetical protein